MGERETRVELERLAAEMRRIESRMRALGGDSAGPSCPPQCAAALSPMGFAECDSHYRSLFESAPGAYLVLTPGEYRIVAVSEAYLKATSTTRDALQDRIVFDAFPDDPADDDPDGVRNLRNSLDRVTSSGRTDVMAVQRYPIPCPEGGFEERYWSPVNVAVHGPDGALAYIIHRVEDVTDYIRHRHASGDGSDKLGDLEDRARRMEADIVLRSQELQRANDELRRSEERFRHTFRDAAVGMAVTTLDGAFLNANQAYCRMTGYTEAELRAIDFRELTHPDDRPKNLELIRELLEGRRDSFVFEKRYIAKDGAVRWVRASVSAQRGPGGEPNALIGVMEDITAQKSAEERLEQSGRLLRMASAISRMGAWSVDIPGMELTWSAEVFDIHELPRTYVPTVDETIRLYAPEHRARIQNAFRACAERGEPYDLELQIVTAKNRRVWVRAVGEAVRGGDGAIVRVQGAFQDISKRKASERRARELEERLTRTLESISDAFFTLDRDWRFQFLNGEAERIFARSRNDLVGKTIWDEFPEARGSDFDRAYRRAAETGASVEFEAYYGPALRWYGVRAYPYEDGLAVYCSDITEKRCARRQLEESEERLRILANATNDAIWQWDLDTGAVWWNEGYKSLIGYRRDEVEPTIESWKSRIHPGDRENVLAGIESAIESGDTWSSDYRYLRNDGGYAYVLDRGRVIRDEQGRPVKMVGGMTDLTERKSYQTRIEEQAALLDQASDAILVRGLDNRVLFWNRRAEEMYGWTAAEAVGRSAADLLYDDPAPLNEATEALLRQGEWSGELQHRAKSGERLIVFGRWTLLRNADGSPRSILAINADITERKRLEQQALHNQRMDSIGTLASGVAHDLNNILAPIIMAIEILYEHAATDETRGIIETLHASAQRGAGLVRQILGAASGRDADRRHVDPAAAVEDVCRIVRDTFPRNIELQAPSAGIPCWPVLADPTQLHQVLMNLCVNARDAMPGGGRLAITVGNIVLDDVFTGMNALAKPGPYVVIGVDDTGTGMSPETQEKIFEPFFTTKEPGQGTGLGLSTTFTIVKNHGGFIHLYSEPGKGSKFKVYLPAVLGAVTAEPAAGEKTDLPRGRGELILLVDDEESVREIARKALQRYGYRVMLAVNGAEGVSRYALHQREIDVVLTDMNMPVMDGPAMIVALKSIDPDVKIIGSSGLAADAHVAKAMGAGVDRFVPKPYTAETLLAMLRTVLDGAAPQPDAPRPAPDHATPPPPAARAASARVLIVDDEESLALLAARVLARDGYTVATAGHGEAALAILQDAGGAFDLVLTDIHMPGVAGEELYRTAIQRYPGLRFVFASGDERLPESLARALDDAPLVLHKPYSNQALRDIVSQAAAR